MAGVVGGDSAPLSAWRSVSLVEPRSVRGSADRAGRDAADLSDAAVVWIIRPIAGRQSVRGGVDAAFCGAGIA